MPLTRSIVAKLKEDFPGIRFSPGETFHWSPNDRTVYYENTTDTASLLHELAHAALEHDTYGRDIELLQMERDAWDYAVHTLAEKYELKLDENEIQDALDTYREWLHARSVCPNCRATGVQTTGNRYTCIACFGEWTVNEARTCALRRYTHTIN